MVCTFQLLANYVLLKVHCSQLPCYYLFLQVDAALFIFAVPVVRIWRKVPFYTKLHTEDIDIDINIDFEGSFSHCATLTEDNADLQVYVFIFESPIGCRSVKHGYHRLLPPCVGPTMNDEELLELKSTASVANSFYYTDPSDAPTIEYRDDGTYSMNFNKRSSGIRSRVGETSRAELFKASLRTHITVENVDQCMPELKGNACMFSGGGDHVMMAAAGNTLYDIGAMFEEEESESVPSPLSQGELRTGANLELKYHTNQSDSDVDAIIHISIYN